MSRRSVLMLTVYGSFGVGMASIGGCSREPSTKQQSKQHKSKQEKNNGAETDDLRRIIQTARSTGKVALLDGDRVYVVREGIDITGVRIVGRGATVRWAGGQPSRGVAGVLNASGAADVSDLNLDLADAGSNRSGLAGIACPIPGGVRPSIRVESVSVKGGGGAGVRVYSATGRAIGNRVGSSVRLVSLRVSNCRFGVQLQGLAGAAVENAHISGCSDNGIRATLCSELSLSGNHITDCGSHGVLVFFTEGCSISGNASLNNGKSGITLGGGDPQLPVTHNAVITENITNNNKDHGIDLDVTQPGRRGIPLPVNAILRENTCVDNRKAGINVECSSNVTLVRNRCVGNANGIVLATRDTTVLSNVCTGNRGWGVAMPYNATTHMYGDHWLAGNTVSGNGGGPYLVAPALDATVHFSKRPR